jgi:cytochrome c-type biogenesis protein CcmH/NrfG
MDSFWIAVAVSLTACLFYIYSSVRNQQTLIEDANQAETPNATIISNNVLIAPLLLLALSPIGYYWLGSLEQQQNWANGEAEFNKIAAGQLEYSDQNIQDLALSLRSAIDRQPGNGDLWFILAETYVQLGMIDLADSAMERALRIEMKPDWLVANAQILMARANEQDIARSALMLNQAITIQPNHQSALLTLGFIHVRQQNYRDAIDIWQKLVFLLKQSGKNPQVIIKQIELAQVELNKSQNENK